MHLQATFIFRITFSISLGLWNSGNFHQGAMQIRTFTCFEMQSLHSIKQIKESRWKTASNILS